MTLRLKRSRCSPYPWKNSWDSTALGLFSIGHECVKGWVKTDILLLKKCVHHELLQRLPSWASQHLRLFTGHVLIINKISQRKATDDVGVAQYEKTDWRRMNTCKWSTNKILQKAFVFIIFFRSEYNGSQRRTQRLGTFEPRSSVARPPSPIAKTDVCSFLFFFSFFNWYYV